MAKKDAKETKNAKQNDTTAEETKSVAVFFNLPTPPFALDRDTAMLELMRSMIDFAAEAQRAQREMHQRQMKELMDFFAAAQSDFDVSAKEAMDDLIAGDTDCFPCAEDQVEAIAEGLKSLIQMMGDHATERIDARAKRQRKGMETMAKAMHHDEDDKTEAADEKKNESTQKPEQKQEADAKSADEAKPENKNQEKPKPARAARAPHKTTARKPAAKEAEKKAEKESDETAAE